MLEKLLFHTFVLLSMEFYFRSMWWFVLIVILSGSRIIRELSLWLYLWEVILTILTEVWRVSHSGWHRFLRGTLDSQKWRKETERHPAFIPVSFFTVDVMPTPSHTPDALTSPLWWVTPWTGSYNNPRATWVVLVLIRLFYHSNRKRSWARTYSLKRTQSVQGTDHDYLVNPLFWF